MAALIVGGAVSFYWFAGGAPDTSVQGQPTSEPDQQAQSRVVFSASAGKFELPAGNSIQLGSSSGKDKTVLIRSTVKPALLNPTNVAYISIPQDLAKNLSGKRVRVVIWARRNAAGGSSPFAIGYSAGSAGASGWFVFTPSSDFAPFRFSYRVPARPESVLPLDRIAVWADIDGKGDELEVRQVMIDLGAN